MVYNQKNLYKYFDDEEIKNFKKWMKLKDVKVSYKTDHDYFVFPLEYSQDITINKLEISNKIEKESTSYEMREYKTKAINHYKLALQTYKQSTDYMEAI